MGSPHRWLVITAQVAPDDPRRDLVAEALLEIGGSSVLEEPTSLTTYLPPPDTPIERFLLETTHLLAERMGGDAPPLTWRWQAAEDWESEWRRGLAARKVSPRFVVKPSWVEWMAEPDEIVLEIDPQMAFGTGEHATTRGCLRLLDGWYRPGDRVLDVGSGSAILSIAAARLGARRVVAVEMDADANLNARENIARNGVDDRIELREQLADSALLERLGRFDLILANILSGVIRPLLPSFRSTLEPNGRLIVSGILQDESDEVLADAIGAGMRVAAEDRDEEWWSAVLVPL